LGVKTSHLNEKFFILDKNKFFIKEKLHLLKNFHTPPEKLHASLKKLYTPVRDEVSGIAVVNHI
jgi:hypothetical protein